MRVAMIGPFGLRPKGTMAARALPLAKALSRRGHQVALFLPPWSNHTDSGKAWNDDGVRVVNVEVTPRAAIAPRLVSHALAWKPEAVHFFKPKAYSGLAQWILWYFRMLGTTRPRLVLDEDDWEGTGGWNDLEDYPRLYKHFFAWQEGWGLTHCDDMTVASRALEAIALSRGVSRRNIHYLPYGVSEFVRPSSHEGDSVRSEYGLGNGPVVLLYTRFFEFTVARLAEVFRRILDQVPSAKLLVLGKGLFGGEQELCRLAEINGWADHLVAIGWVEPARLPSLFSAADIALYPFDDTLVNMCKCAVKLGDLLASGVPVVAESVGQLKAYIVNGETGVLVKSGDIEQFAGAAVDLLRDESRRALIGSCAAAFFAREYSWDKWADVAEAAYGVRATRGFKRP